MTRKVFWDKGHGGTDPGAVNGNLKEADLVHAIVEHAMAYLNDNYTGFEQRTSRTGNQTVDLNKRDDLADNWGADVFVSVHINAGKGTGFESFIYNGNVSAATQGLQNMLHVEIMAAMRKFGSITDRGKKRANFSVLRETNMPSVLTENLFIDSNDNKHLKNSEFIKEVGQAHARGVAKFLGLAEKPKKVEVAKVEEKSVKIKTGGLTAEMVGEVAKFIIEKNWWSQVQFTSDGNNPTLLTGGLSGAALDEFEAWLKQRGWYYNIV